MRLELVSRGYRRRIVELAAAISDDFASFDGPVTPAQRQPWPNHH
jgi:hypothetical protein